MTKQGKRYYWLKLHENFFRQAVIRFLRKMPEGDSIVIIYLELLLMSIKTDGYVRTDGLYDTMEKDLKTGGTIGRKLDFLAQEMNREANTTLSKSTDLTVADNAIFLKTTIEKIREQIQNIE